MNKKVMGISLLVIGMLLCSVSSVCATQTVFNGVEINPDRSGLEINFSGHNIILWHLNENVDGITKEQYALSQNTLNSQGIVVVDGTQFYQLKYDNSITILLQVDVDGLSVTIEASMLKKYVDSSLQLVYVLNNDGNHLVLERDSISSSTGIITIDRAEAQGFFEGIWEQIVQFFQNLAREIRSVLPF